MDLNFNPTKSDLKQRYFIELAYKGTHYHGWQVQPNACSVQEEMERALSTICREEIAVTGAGRTDTGVHASYYVAHFDSENEKLDSADFVHKLNRFLGPDLVIFCLTKVDNEAHARFSAVSRTYHYFIQQQKNPFTRETAWQFNRNLNIQKMNEACKVLFEFEDFTSFSKLHTDVKTNNCKMYRAEWKQEGSKLLFVVQADRFLRNMVRAIVGTMVEVGQGKLTVNGFRQIIEARDRGAAGTSVPAEGLFLADIAYPGTVFVRTVPAATIN
ncbi:MAG: tRNA pseudouridine(38-40) synthase TruA [Mangrovibacterium sp.]